MEAIVWQIRDWATIFEDHKSREVAKLRFCKWPVGRHGEAYRMLAQTMESVAAFGVFASVVQDCASLPFAFRVRGILHDDRGPLTMPRIAVRIFIPLPIVSAAFDLLTSQAIAWIAPASGLELDQARDEWEASRRLQLPAPTAPRRLSADPPPTERRSTVDQAPTERRPSADVPPTGAQPKPNQTLPPPPPDPRAGARDAEQVGGGGGGGLVEKLMSVTGVTRGRARQIAAYPGLTGDLLNEVWNSVVNDRKVQSRPAVFAVRIAEACGVNRPGKG